MTRRFNPVACALAIADKMDTWRVSSVLPPASESCDKDPFALRRAALGVLRIIAEKNLNLICKR